MKQKLKNTKQGEENMVNTAIHWEDIAYERGQRGLKQYELAEMIGVTSSYLSTLEKGHHVLTQPLAERIVYELARWDAKKRVTNEGVQPDEDSKEPYENVEKKAISTFHEVAWMIADILEKKNHDYGDSFHNVYKEFGDVSTYIRLSDKLGRLATLVKGIEAKVKEESIDDAYMDIAGYCILTLVSKEKLKKGDK